MITNYLSPIGFTVHVARLPNVEFFTQRATIPGVTMEPAALASPMSNLFAVGDRLQYQDLDISFLVDENMENYAEAFNWMEALTSPENFDAYTPLENGEYGLSSDIKITVLNSNKNSNMVFTYLNCFPLSLSPINMDVTATDITPPEVNMSFRYDRFKFERSP
tara:strand:+ start:667 stop:1155 length:489 start_codon:yes stop_codon:yes gene_type:complete